MGLTCWLPVSSPAAQLPVLGASRSGTHPGTIPSTIVHPPHPSSVTCNYWFFIFLSPARARRTGCDTASSCHPGARRTQHVLWRPLPPGAKGKKAGSSMQIKQFFTTDIDYTMIHAKVLVMGLIIEYKLPIAVSTHILKLAGNMHVHSQI